MTRTTNILFVKPPDRFLENEFIYQQLGPHYLQSFLHQNGISSDLLILYKNSESHSKTNEYSNSLSDLDMLLIREDETYIQTPFDENIFDQYSIVAFSVMTPQAPDAYQVNREIKKNHPQITTVIGGSHPRYYLNQVRNLPDEISFDFIVPQDGWNPMLEIAQGIQKKNSSPIVLEDRMPRLDSLPPPTRPQPLMDRYQFDIGGVPAFHTITALGCPFTCHFCESGIESVRTFSKSMIEEDLENISAAHDRSGNAKKSVMFFDDVGLMSPKQVARLATMVERYGFTTWRAFTHAYLIVRHKDKLLVPFYASGGKRIGIGIETGSQRSLDLINKRNGKFQSVSDHYEAITIANDLGIAVDAFTMIYPWEDERDLMDTTKLVEFVANNKVNGIDAKGRPLKNHVDSTIMSPFQGTKFFDLIEMGAIPDVRLDPAMDPGTLYYKGNGGLSGWPYIETKLPRQEYEAAQTYRNSLRPKYR